MLLPDTAPDTKWTGRPLSASCGEAASVCFIFTLFEDVDLLAILLFFLDCSLFCSVSLKLLVQCFISLGNFISYFYIFFSFLCKLWSINISIYLWGESHGKIGFF